MGEIFLISPIISLWREIMIEGLMTGEIWERYGRDDGREKISRNPLFKGVSGV